MRFRNPLDKILPSKTKVIILRHLVNYGREISVREFSREIGIAPPNMSKALKGLALENVLVWRRFGNSIVYRLNKGHFLADKIIIPLFKNEAMAKKELERKIIKHIDFSFESIILFGSVAKGREKSDSDIDLAFIIKDSLDADKIEKKIFDINPDLSKRFGNTVSPIVIKKSDFVKRLKIGEGLVSSIAKEGEVISGKLISDLL